MEWTIAFPNPNLPPLPLQYPHKIFLIGSCFTEHIGNFLKDHKFNVLVNPMGVLFDPCAIAFHLLNFAKKQHTPSDHLFFYQELWHSWKHHSQFSSTSFEKTYQTILNAEKKASEFLQDADWLIITLGTSYTYRLTEHAPQEHLHKWGVSYPVANCHKCPAQWFFRYLLPLDETYDLLYQALSLIQKVNPKVHILLNISPVRHLRDGVIANNRSKARLIEVTHLLTENLTNTFYLPSYEIIIDVLRDYRFYDIDKAHPNYEATQWVIQFFTEHYLDSQTKQYLSRMQDIRKALLHRPQNPNTQAHQQFLNRYFEKVCQIEKELPFLNFEEEKKIFSSLYPKDL